MGRNNTFGVPISGVRWCCREWSYNSSLRTVSIPYPVDIIRHEIVPVYVGLHTDNIESLEIPITGREGGGDTHSAEFSPQLFHESNMVCKVSGSTLPIWGNRICAKLALT